MPYTTVVAGTTITAAWGNANVRDQVVTPFATPAARASAITSSVEGMLSYRADTKSFEGYDGLQWVPMPGTLVKRGNRTTSSSTTTTEVGVLRLDNISMIANHTYLLLVSPSLLFSSVSGDVVGARLRYDATGVVATTSSTALAGVSGYASTFSSATPLIAKYIPGANQTVSILLTCARLAGTGNCSLVTNASFPDIDLMVVDLSTAVTDTGVDI